MWSKVRLGNNVMHGAPVARTSFVVAGSRLFDAELRGDLLLVGADVYDEHGRRVGVFAANRWTAQTSAFILSEPDRIVVEDVRDSTVLLDVAVTETQLDVSAMRLGTRDGRLCVLDERGGLTLHSRRAIASPQYIIGDSTSTALGRIDLAAVFAQAPPAMRDPR
jgi:hypothetical protein